MFEIVTVEMDNFNLPVLADVLNKRKITTQDLLDVRPQAFLAGAVKSLCIPFFASTASAQRALTICTGVTKLGIWLPDQEFKECSESLLVLPLKKLSIEMGHLSACLKGGAPPVWLPTLTHLQLIVQNHHITSGHGPPHIPFSLFSSLEHVVLSSGHESGTLPFLEAVIDILLGSDGLPSSAHTIVVAAQGLEKDLVPPSRIQRGVRVLYLGKCPPLFHGWMRDGRSDIWTLTNPVDGNL